MRLLRRILVELRHLAAKVCLVVALATVFVGYATPMISPAATEQLPPRTKLTVLVGAAPGGGRPGEARADLAPGAGVIRPLDVTLQAPTPVPVGMVLSVRRGGSSLLDRDAGNGLRVSIDRCTVGGGWRARPRRAGYECPGKVATVVAAVPIARIKGRLVRLPDVASNRTVHLLVTLTLPATAGNAFERLQSSLDFTFIAR